MSNEIISYIEMCQREGVSLQRGMNFNLGGDHSVILMSLRPGSPYDDELKDAGSTLIYEGHDQPKHRNGPDPKSIDQPYRTESGQLTQNALFYEAAKDFKAERRLPERVRVYEKLRTGIWSYNGVFHLLDSWIQTSGGRNVFRFKLVAVEGGEDFSLPPIRKMVARRVIPTSVKLEVWVRDEGKCVICGATDELHFDHDLPFSKGGTSLVAENVKLMCARHNLQKRDKIE